MRSNRTLGMQQDHVLVVLPAHNEEIALAATIRSVKSVLPKSEIVVVDNLSSDSTAEIARSNDVAVLSEPRRGKGFAVQRGFDYALTRGAKIIVLIDADNTYDVEEFPYAIDLILHQGFDLVTGIRVPSLRPGDGAVGEQTHFRFGHRAGNRMFVAISDFLLPTGIRDALSGWRVMSRRFVASFPGEAKGFEIEAQLNTHAFNMQAATTNIDIKYFPRLEGSNSKLNTYRDGLKILRETLRNFRNHRPLLAFSLLATPWAILTIYLVYLPVSSYIEEGVVPYLPRLVAGVGTFIVAALLWSSGMILERLRQIRIGIALRVFNQNSF